MLSFGREMVFLALLFLSALGGNMKIKQGVDLTGMHPQMIHAFNALLAIHIDDGYEATVTSGREGKHSATSSHYSGNAIDVRTKDLPPTLPIETFAQDIRERLPVGFRVIIEGEGQEHEHVHVQYRPVWNEIGLSYE